MYKTRLAIEPGAVDSQLNQMVTRSRGVAESKAVVLKQKGEMVRAATVSASTMSEPVILKRSRRISCKRKSWCMTTGCAEEHFGNGEAVRMSKRNTKKANIAEKHIENIKAIKMRKRNTKKKAETGKFAEHSKIKETKKQTLTTTKKIKIVSYSNNEIVEDVLSQKTKQETVTKRKRKIVSFCKEDDLKASFEKEGNNSTEIRKGIAGRLRERVQKTSFQNGGRSNTILEKKDDFDASSSKDAEVKEEEIKSASSSKDNNAEVKEEKIKSAFLRKLYSASKMDDVKEGDEKIKGLKDNSPEPNALNDEPPAANVPAYIPDPVWDVDPDSNDSGNFTAQQNKDYELFKKELEELKKLPPMSEEAALALFDDVDLEADAHLYRINVDDIKW